MSPEPTLRIAYLLHRFPYLTETFVVRELQQLAVRGHRIDVYSLLRPRHDVAPEGSESFLGSTSYVGAMSWAVLLSQLVWISTHPLRYLRALSRVFAVTATEPDVMIRALALFPKSTHFARLIRAAGTDHVHAEFVWLESIAAETVHILTGLPFSIHPHAFGLFGRRQQNVRRQLEAADAVVAISTFHEEYIARLCPGLAPERLHLSRCGVDPDMLSPVERPPRASPLRILSIGRDTAKKGHRHLLDACALLSERGVDFECTIVGPGGGSELSSLIEARGLSECVLLRQPVPESDIRALLADADLFALACVVLHNGDRDGIPLVLMEAMAMQVPVVTTPVGGIRDLVIDGETGSLVPEGEAMKLADAIEDLAKDPEERARLGRAGRDHVLTHFDIRRNVAVIAKMMEGGESAQTLVSLEAVDPGAGAKG